MGNRFGLAPQLSSLRGTNSAYLGFVHPFVKSLPALLRRLPIKTFIVVLAACWFAKDNYPLSHFPMYDKFPDHTFYIFLKDGNDDPIPLQEITGTRTASFKKPYDRELNAIRKKLKKRKRELSIAERQPAALRSLETLYRNATPPVKKRLEKLSPLRLYHADIYMTAEGIDERPPELIAELELKKPL